MPGRGSVPAFGSSGGGGGGGSDATLTTTDVTTNDVTSTKHGFAPKTPGNANKFLNGAATAAWASTDLGGCLVGSSADQTLTGDNAFHQITWDTEVYDDAAYHSVVSNTSRLTIPTGGGGAGTRYLIACHIDVTSATNNIDLYICKNTDGAGSGRLVGVRVPIAGLGGYDMEVTYIDPVDADYFDVVYTKPSVNATMNHGLGIAIDTHQAGASWFRIEKLR